MSIFSAISLFFIFIFSNVAFAAEQERKTLSAIPLPDWHFFGSTTSRYDAFHSKGNTAASPYRFDGGQFYNEFNLNFDRKVSDFHKITGQMGGLLYNGSKYRGGFYGVVPERFNVTIENGETATPYRLAVGDIYPYLSFRTMQRSLKGVQLELQPDFGTPGQNSILLFSAAGSPSWRSFQVRDDWSNGISWLVNHPRYGRVSANFVLNNKQVNPAAALLSRRQAVYSLAWEKQAVFFGERLTIETEAGRFEGDHPSLTGVGIAQNTRGNGYFAQVSGQPVALSAFNYRVRYEAYDQDYQPNGASIQSNRRSAEGHLSWRFDSGLTAAARWQSFRTNWRTNNPLDSIVSGINISGSLPFLERFSGSVDAFKQTATSRDHVTNTVTSVVNVNASKTINQRVSAHGALYYSYTQDKNNVTNGISLTRQASVGMDFRTNALGFEGSVSPGFLARRVDLQGNKTIWDINPTLNINARRDHHTVSLSLSSLDQSRPQNDLGLLTQTAGLNYRYTYNERIHLGAEGNWYARNPDSMLQQRTDVWRAGFFLTYNFDKPVQMRPQPVEQRAETVATSQRFDGALRFALDITQFKLGTPRIEALKMIEGAGAPAEQPGVLIWFARLLRDIDQSQRLGVEIRHDQIARIAVVIGFGDVGNSLDAQRTFERVRKEVVEKYGQPDRFFNQGKFGTNMATELIANRFIRVMEWRRNGGILRFGIPRRVDGKVRMELQFSRSFPALEDSLWSMEEMQ